MRRYWTLDMNGKWKHWFVFVAVFITHLYRIDGGPADIELSSSYAFPVYNFYVWNKDNRHRKKYSEPVYWKHLEMAYRKNPEAIRNALLESVRTQNKRNIVADRFGRRHVWDPRFGFIPIVTDTYNQPDIKSVPISWKQTPYGLIAWRQTPSGPVAWRQTPSGPVPISQNFNPGYNRGQRNMKQENIPVWCDPRFAEHMKPVLASDGPSLDPCNPKQQSEFGMTATSEMTDMLCSFCQVIKHLSCVWQFCSHPEGVYRINLHEHFKK